MMRKGTSGGRRGIVIAAIVVALAVAAPELAGPAGAAVDRGAARRTMTTAQKKKAQQYIQAHPEVLTKHKKQLTTNVRGKLVKRKVRRKVSRKTRAAQRKRAAKRKAKARANARKRKARRRGAVAGKQRRARNTKKAKKQKKGATSGSTKLIHGIALLFLIGLPFIAVGLLLFGTDYRRRPRAVSNKKRRRVLVITPVGRKY